MALATTNGGSGLIPDARARLARTALASVDSDLEAGPSSPRGVVERVLSAAAVDLVIVADLSAAYVGPPSVRAHGLEDDIAWRTAVWCAGRLGDVKPPVGSEAWTGSMSDVSASRGAPGPLAGCRGVLFILRAEGGRPRTLVVVGRRGAEFGDAERRRITSAAARPEPREVPLVAALEAVADRTGVPLGLLENGRLMWAAPTLWRAVGIPGGVRLGRAFAHDAAPEAAARLEAAGRHGADGLDVTVLPGELLLVQATRPADAARSARTEELSRRWRLSPAERNELQHLMLGLSCKEAAARLGVSPETVRGRRKQIYRKARVGGAGPLRALLDGTATTGAELE